MTARARSSALVATLFPLLGLAGCGLLGRETRYLERGRADIADVTAPSWHAIAVKTGSDAASRVPRTWWQELDDPVLDALIVEALANNHDLEVAAARVVAAEAEARIVASDLYPWLGANFDAQRQKNVYTGFPIPSSGGGNDDVLATTSNRFGVSLDISWEVDLWGRLRAARRAARAEAEAARIAYDGARLSLAGQTAKTYFALVEAREQLALAEETLESYRTTSEQVMTRYERGTRPALDVRLALTQSAGAEARVADRRSILENITRQLEVLVGRYPAASFAATGVLDHETRPIPVGLPAELLGRRPDLAEAARRVYAGDERIRSAKAALLPRIGLTGSAGSASEEIGDLLDGSFGVWSIAANLAQPIFEGGRLRAGVDLARARAAGAEAEYVGLALRAFAEVENALADEGHLESLVVALDEAAAQSIAAESLADQRYLGGLESYVTVLSAKRTALEARSALIDARRRRLETRIDLYLALGGGFAEEERKS
jgi:multidrug efflux system outer membrane protein